VSAATPHVAGTNAVARDLLDAGISVSPLPCIDPWEGGAAATPRELRQATWQTARVLRRAAPDVVHLTLPWPEFGMASLGAPALLNVPAVVVFQLVPASPALRWPAIAYKLIKARRQRWVAVSGYARDTLAGALRMTADSIDVIRNGASAAFYEVVGYDERARTRRAIRHELGLPTDATLILSVGRLHEQKGHANLCAAVAPLVQRDERVHLVIAGDGPERVNLERLTDQLQLSGRVQWLGHRDDARRLLIACDLFAFPSRFEGAPFALAEAMAMGVPVVTAAFPGADEMVDNRRHGVVVPVSDVLALRHALEWALEHEDAMAAMGRAARDRAEEFSAERMLDSTLDLLEQAASARGSRRINGAAASRRRCSRPQRAGR
jgi:glycosyltransferase involved in cell wall biosynthesis